MHISSWKTFAHQTIASKDADIHLGLPLFDNGLPLHFVEPWQNLPPHPSYGSKGDVIILIGHTRRVSLRSYSDAQGHKEPRLLSWGQCFLFYPHNNLGLGAWVPCGTGYILEILIKWHHIQVPMMVILLVTSDQYLFLSPAPATVPLVPQRMSRERKRREEMGEEHRDRRRSHCQSKGLS